MKVTTRVRYSLRALLRLANLDAIDRITANPYNGIPQRTLTTETRIRPRRALTEDELRRRLKAAQLRPLAE